jgi:hypothetical protein
MRPDRFLAFSLVLLFRAREGGVATFSSQLEQKTGKDVDGGVDLL